MLLVKPSPTKCCKNLHNCNQPSDQPGCRDDFAVYTSALPVVSSSSFRSVSPKQPGTAVLRTTAKRKSTHATALPESLYPRHTCAVAWVDFLFAVVLRTAVPGC